MHHSKQHRVSLLWMLVILCIASLPMISTSKPYPYSSLVSSSLSKDGLWETVFGVGRGGQSSQNSEEDKNGANPSQSMSGSSNVPKKNSPLPTSTTSKKFVKKSQLSNKKKEPSGASSMTAAQNTIESSISTPEAPNSFSPESEREALYEAYNQLHTLAQDFQKPFDAPAVIVVGHQTSGKSALIEALMGFQFNQVGGGTKTRRPIALRMQYNPNCLTPLCFLTLENGKEEQRSLADIQAYIEAENKRLERDPSRSFDPREINIRMEYRYCPNMIVIDTPGLIHPPKGRQLTVQQRAIAQAAREAESLVLSKIRCQDYIILCVEDTTDWKHATTRNIVMQADPQLSRTVLVTTKLDTKLPQFSEAEDLEEFLNAPLIKTLFSQMLGGPFFTTVPSGRVGSSRDLDTNEAFVQSLRRAERFDRAFIHTKMGPMRARNPLQQVGVSRLRAFLESRVEDCYRRNVAKIVPLLQNELRHTQERLGMTEEELKSLSIERLKQSANIFRDRFAKELSHVIQGTVRVSPELFGETLETEQLKGGHFLTNDQLTPNHGGLRRDRDNSRGNPSRSSSASTNSVTSLTTVNGPSSDQWHEIIEREVGNNHHKLFGGAQILRAFREFTIAVRHMQSPIVSEDEIANAAGIGEAHNGVNFMRAACVIAMDKAQQSFEPLLEALHHRMEHVMKRTFPIIQHLIRTSPSYQQTSFFSSLASSASSAAATSAAFVLDPNHRQFQETVRRIYDSFIEMKLQEALKLCRADLYGMTKFVSWDIEDRSGSSTLFRLLPTPKRMVEIYKLALAKRDRERRSSSTTAGRHPSEEADANEDAEGYDDVFLSPDHSDADSDSEMLIEDEEDMEDRRGNNKKKSSSMSDRVMDEWRAANGKTKSRSDVKLATNKKPIFNMKNKVAQFGVKKSNADSQRQQQQQQLAVTALPEDDPELNDYYKVVQLTEEMVCGSNSSRTSTLITSLVQYIISSWRNYFARSTAMKFNSYFIVPFTEEFPNYLRDELEKYYDSSMSELFDIAETRRALVAKREELLSECDANNKLQKQFDRISSQLSTASKDGSSKTTMSSASFAAQEKAMNDALSDTDYLFSNQSQQGVESQGLNEDISGNNGDNGNDLP